MYDIWANVAELDQPCLYRPIADQLLGADGLVRKEILTSIDRLLCEQLLAGSMAFQARTLLASPGQVGRYLNTSAMQKAIRRGDTELAMLCAQRGCLDDPTYTFRRLATCAVEDVGIGNLKAVAMALAVLGSKQTREHGAPEELAAYVAYLLAISPKSRLAPDLLSIADYDPALSRRRRELSRRSEQDLRSLALDPAQSTADRMIAAWFLAGTARFRGVNMPVVRRDRSNFVQLISRSRAPLLLYYLADRTAARLSDAMSVSWLLMSNMIDGDPPTIINGRDLKPSPWIGDFPAYTYDLHTLEGRVALSRFIRECGPIVQAIAAVPVHKREMAIRHAVFLIEGGQLSQQLGFREATEIERRAQWSELACCGLLDATLQRSFIDACRANIADLDAIRADQAHVSDHMRS